MKDNERITTAPEEEKTEGNLTDIKPEISDRKADMTAESRESREGEAETEENRESREGEAEENRSSDKKKRHFHPGRGTAGFAAGLLTGLGILLGVCLYAQPDAKAAEIEKILKTEAITEATEEDIQNGKYDGMLAALGDTYADYFTAEETRKNQQNRSGSYAGIGLAVSESDDGSFIIPYVYEDSPAEEAGIEAGDVIIAVGDTSVVNDSYIDDDNAGEGTSMSELLQLIAAMENDVRLTVSRGGETLDFALTPREITLKSVYYELTDESIGYIAITTFNQTTAEQFRTAVDELENQNMKALIVDLRNNGGGLVDITRECLERILPAGLMVYTETRDGTRTEYSATGKTPLEVPMAILVNSSTASAAEIFSGACRDRLGAILVGETTYGKGIIQTTKVLGDGSSIKYTTAHYYTPGGTNLNGVGLEPDIAVSLEGTENTTIAARSSEDTQYQAAREALREKLS